MKRRFFKVLAVALALIVALGGCAKKQNTVCAALEDKSPDEIIEMIYENHETGLAVQTMDVDLTNADTLSYYTGLDDAEGVSQAAVSEAMIGAQAYSLVVVRAENPAQTQTIAQAMRDGINQAKWICVEADDLRVVACGDVIMLVMVSSQLSDTVTAQDMVDAFVAVAQQEPSVDLQ